MPIQMPIRVPIPMPIPMSGPGGELYLSGDLVKRDADGYLWFVGRADDVIKASGHLIGPFEVENVLTDHPAVAEAAVIGKPDPTYGAVVVKASSRSRPGTPAMTDCAAS